MPVQGAARQYDEIALFTIEIDGIELGAFQSCSEFEETCGLIEQREGGNKAVASKTDGIRTFTPLTLVRGASSDTSVYDWYQQVKSEGAYEAERNVSVVRNNPNGTEKSRLNLTRAWPLSYKRGMGDAEADENSKEEIVLEFIDADWIVTP